MSTLEIKNRLSKYSLSATYATEQDVALKWYEHILLAIGIFEIPLQIDKYFMFHEADADLGAVGGFNISMTTLCFGLLYLFWIVQTCTQRINWQNRKLIVGLPMICYLGLVAISLVSAKLPLLGIFDVALLVQSYFIFFYLANRIRSRKDLYWLLSILFLSVIFQGFLLAGLKAMGESVYGTQMDYGPLALVVWDDGRPAGSMHSAVLAGSFLATLWLPALAVFTTPIKGWVKTLAVAAIMVGGIGILLTQTRGAILTTALGSMALSVACYSRRWLPNRVIVMAVVLAIVGAIPMMQVIKNRIQGDDKGSAEARIHLAAIASEMIQDRPLFGFGAGNCHIAAQAYADQAKYRSLWFYTIHNKYLLVWIETGLVGLFAFLMILFAGVRDGFSAWNKRERFLGPLGFGIAVAILGHMLHMGADIFNSRTQVQILWVVLGMAAAVRIMAQDEFESPVSDVDSDQSNDGDTVSQPDVQDRLAGRTSYA